MNKAVYSPASDWSFVRTNVIRNAPVDVQGFGNAVEAVFDVEAAGKRSLGGQDW